MAKCYIRPNSNDKIGYQIVINSNPSYIFQIVGIFGPSLNVKIGFQKAKCYIRPNSNDKIGYQTSKCNNRPEFESQNRISNVKILYLAQVRMSK